MSYHTTQTSSGGSNVYRNGNGDSTETTAAEGTILSDSSIQLGNLTYEGIKQSIINYLQRTDSPLSDLDFTSSALNVLIDALTYNTMYYGFYSNMIANELYLDTAQRMESLISITKPLGFTVRASVAARATVDVENLTARIPQYSKFTGTDADGSNYNFYTLQSYELDTTTNKAENVILYEAKDLILRRDITNLVNTTNQTFTLNDDRIDIDSIEIEVSTDGGSTFSTYSKSEFVNSTISEDSTIYFVERLNKGVKIIFSARANGELVDVGNPNLETDNVGRRILPTDKIRISYLIPSGKVANEIRKFTYTDGNGTARLVSESFAGSDGPDPELIRFFAPKWFAAQDRAVTRNDYLGLIKDFVPDGSNPEGTVSVFGGEELDPPYYGRVFVSLLTTGPQQANDLLDLLREKSPLSIMPEYIPPQTFQLNLSYTVFFNSLNTQKNKDQLSFDIRENVEQNYGGSKFNNNFVASRFNEIITRTEPNAILPENIITDITIETDFDVNSAVIDQISFRNKIKRGAIGQGLKSSRFYSPRFDRDDVFLVDSGLDPNLYGFSPLYLGRDNGAIIEVVEQGGVGEINYKTGLIKINPRVTGNEEIKLTVKPENNSVSAKQQMVLNIVQQNVEVKPL